MTRQVLSVLFLVSGMSQAQKLQPNAPVIHAEGYSVGPTVLKDAGCAKDYVTAVRAGGLDGRKKLSELAEYGCLISGDDHLVYYVAGRLRTVAGVNFISGAAVPDLEVMERISPHWYEACKRGEANINVKDASGYFPASDVHRLS